ncbi:MAG: hypothetical protein K6F97_00610 [Lachnospiraceae bacterium]|nr:hypothetical protein [Lachnospiraceae bacterium]
MAYFDSPKNKAMWNKELAGLRAEKQERAKNGYQARNASKSVNGAAKNNPRRRKINLKELERIEMEANGVRRVKRPVKQRDLVKTNQVQKNEQKKATL